MATNLQIPSRRRKSGLENYCWWAFNTLSFWAAIIHRFTQHRFSWLTLWDLPLMILYFLINNFSLNSIVSRTHQLIKVITGGNKWCDNSKPVNMSQNVSLLNILLIYLVFLIYQGISNCPSNSLDNLWSIKLAQFIVAPKSTYGDFDVELAQYCLSIYISVKFNIWNHSTHI